MDPVTIARFIKEGMVLLKVGKDTFYPDKTLSEAESLLRKELSGNVHSLQAQVQAHREVMDKLVEQVKADKEMIEKHNEVLIHLSEAAEETSATVSRLRLLVYSALAVSGLAVLGVVLLAIFR